MTTKQITKNLFAFLLILITTFSSLCHVYATKNISFSNIKIKAGKTININLKNSANQKYKIKIKDTKIARQIGKITRKSDKDICKIKGLKKGQTTANVFIGDKKIGSFKIKVLRADAKIKNKYKSFTLKHNSHGSNAYMTDCHIYVKDIVKNMNPHRKYTVSSNDYNIVNHTSDGLIYTVNKGKTTLTIYEKNSKNKIKSLGTVSIKVKETKMAYVAKENKKFYPQGIFGKGNKYECVYLGEESNTINIQKRIKECLINNEYTGSKFKKSEYKIKYTSLDKKIAVVSDDGRVTGVKKGKTKIKYTIIFSDKSLYTNYCHISVEENSSL